jgi:hypothetical protein
MVNVRRSAFLVGFKKQIENMFDEKRRTTTFVFLGMTVATVVSALWIKFFLLVLVCVFVQFCAYIWYTASYIPYGRECLSGCLKGLWSKCTGNCSGETSK